MHSRKAQSAMEYLMTYGWAILVIAVVLAILFSLGVFSGTPLLGTSCLAGTGYMCGQPLMYTNGNLVVTFGESLGQPITLTGLACTSTANAPSTFQSVGSLQLSPGGTTTVTFSCPLSANTIGAHFSGYLWAQYNSQTQSGNVGKVATVTASASAKPAGAGGAIPAPVLDAHVSGGACCSQSSIQTPAFSTTNTNDMIIVIVNELGSVAGVPSVSDTSGLTWNEQYGGSGGLGSCSSGVIYVFYATPGMIVSGDKVTVSLSGATTYLGAFVIAAKNLNAWDPNVSLPSVSVNGGTSVSTSYSTTNSNDLVLGTGIECNGDSIWSWSGLTQLDTAASGEFSDAYTITSSPQTGASAGFGSGSSWVGVAVGAASST